MPLLPRGSQSYRKEEREAVKRTGTKPGKSGSLCQGAGRCTVDLERGKESLFPRGVDFERGWGDAGEEAQKEESGFGCADPSASLDVVEGCPGRIQTRKLGARLWRLQVEWKMWI